MGQYFLVVNPVKREFLDPHHFGEGLKLMEFTNGGKTMQACAILLAHSNGRGGGDLHSEKVKDNQLIGSWAGDPVIVAGDYDDPWLYVPDDLKGKPYTWVEDNGYHVKKTTHHEVFGKRKNRGTGESEDCGETLYSAARQFFTDLSDRMIALIAKSEGGYHPFAAMDLASNGWRDVPEWGVLPEKEPVKPAGGKKIWERYKEYAKPFLESAVSDLLHHVRCHPEKADELLARLKTLTVTLEEEKAK